MSSDASLGRSERVRLFFGLPIPPGSAERLVAWQRGTLGAGRGLRLLPPEHLHVTLAFLGSRPAAEVGTLREALHEAAAGIERPVLVVSRYRETERVAMLVFEDREGRATVLQARLSGLLEARGAYRPERRPWLAHVTVARFRERPRLSPALPAAEEISPSEAALYHSILRPSGAQYDVVEVVSLREKIT